MISSRFTKAERITFERTIELLFQNREALFIYPFRVIRIEDPFARDGDPPVKVLVSVPKKRFKHAVKRNQIKRLIREAYRIQRHKLSVNNGKQYAIAFQYVAQDVRPYSYVERKMGEVLAAIDRSITPDPIF